MGVEHAQMQAVNAWASGKPFDVYSGKTVNQKMLTVLLLFLKALTAGTATDIAQAAREFRARVEQQIGRLSEGRRKGGAGLYAFPAKEGGLADEARTTSHYHLHLAWLAAGLWAYRQTLTPRPRMKLDADAEGAVDEIDFLRVALLDWLWWELSWAHVCYVPGVGVLSPCRRHRRGANHQLVLTSPDRDNLYRLLILDGQDIDPKYRRQAAKPTNPQQLGFRLMTKLLDAKDPGLLEVVRRIGAGELAEVWFWDQLDVYRMQGELVAFAHYEKQGRDDTSIIDTVSVAGEVLVDDPRAIVDALPDWIGCRTTFAGSRDAANRPKEPRA